MNGRPFVSTLGNLMYAQVCAKPNTTFVISVLGKYLSNHGNDHQMAAKKMMGVLTRYQKNTVTYKRVDNLKIKGYIDSYLDGCPDDRKSNSEYIFILVGGVISWKSKK